MISSARTKLAAAAGMILVFATVLLFMRIFPGRESLYMTGLCFVILGVALPIGGFIWVEDSGIMQAVPGYKAGVYTLFFVYGVSAVSLAVVLIILKVDPGLLAVFEVVLLMGFTAVLVFAGVLDVRRGQGRTAAAAAALMHRLEDEVYAMVLAPENAGHKEQLRRVGEALKYSDLSGTTELDAALEEKIRELKYALKEEPPAGEGLDSQRQVDLVADDIVRLTKSRDHELLSEKKARSIGYGR